jgi:F0F1-type ATP synthase assembly protein I
MEKLPSINETFGVHPPGILLTLHADVDCRRRGVTFTVRSGVGGKYGSSRCVAERPEARSRLAAGIAMASSITTIGLEFTIPVGLGFMIDRHWNTSPVATILGAVLGFLTGMMHVLRVAKSLSPPPGSGSRAAAKGSRARDRDRGTDDI